jgi:mannosylglucosylglycerate synthase
MVSVNTGPSFDLSTSSSPDLSAASGTTTTVVRPTAAPRCTSPGCAHRPPTKTNGGSRYGGCIPTAVLLSFRLGGSDGVAVEAAKWQHALGTLGFATRTVAGAGCADDLLPGLAMGAAEPPPRGELERVLDGADLVVVENLCSLPLNPAAAAVVADVLAGRPAVLHHHDLPWQRPQFAGHPPPPTDRHWRHVTINELSRRQLGACGIEATTVYNSFDVPAPGAERDRRDEPGEVRQAVRGELGVEPSARLVLQPTRALPRKNVAGGMEVAATLDAVYWLLGPAEDGYDDELARLVARARGPVRLGPPAAAGRVTAADAYGAADVVVLPSTWEGFGNPSVESAAHRRPLAIGPYPVAAELAAFGFRWFPLEATDALAEWLADPDPDLLDHNQAVAARHFSVGDLPDRIAAVLPPL